MSTGSVRCASSVRGWQRRSPFKRAALLSFLVASLAGLVLALLVACGLLLVWRGLHRGGLVLHRRLGRRTGTGGRGAPRFFVFFGLVATVGTTFVQAE